MRRTSLAFISMLTFVLSYACLGADRHDTANDFHETPGLSGTMTPEKIDFNSELLVNPGKGWITYGNDNHLNAFANQNQETWSVASVGYLRFNWSTLEPYEGDYRWEYIDNALMACKAQGKKLAFGVMSLNSHAATLYVTPQYVFEAGAKYTKGVSKEIPNQKMVIPVWDDPIYLSKLEKFLRALAARYDGNPDIAFMDIRGYGNWGENHVVWGFSGASRPLKAAQYQALYLAMYREIFPNTLLATANSRSELNAAFRWGMDNGITGRNDGAIYDREAAFSLRKYRNKLPTILEFWGSYSNMRQMGVWQDGYLRQDIESACASYVSLGQYGGSIPMVKEKRPLVIEAGNRMGYYFVLEQLQYDRLGLGDTAYLSLKWTNKGVAPIFIPCYVAVALLDLKTGQVVEKLWLKDSDPKNWLPGKTIVEDHRFAFQRRQGRYLLALGLFSDTKLENPDIKLGIAGKNPAGWYTLMEISGTER